MKIRQNNIIYLRGRAFFDWGTKNSRSIPFTQISYLPCNENCKKGIIHIDYMENGKSLMSTQFPVEPMNVRRFSIPGGQGIQMKMLESGTDIFISVLKEDN